MKVFTLNGSRVLLAVFGFLVISATVFAVLISRYDAAGVFSNGKDLPIYSVDCPEKNVAITFDCAWGAGM